MTKSEMIEVMNIYIAPLYQAIGALMALLLLVVVYFLVIHPFIKRL